MKQHSAKLLVLALTTASVVLAFKVSTDYDHKTNFSKFKTYSWLQVKAEGLWADRVRSDVDSQLAAKGWRPVPSGGDASVAAFGSTQQQPRLDTFYTNFGGGWYWQGFGDGMSTTTVENTPVGTLTVDIFDTQTKKLVWRGTATDAVSSKPEKNEKKLADDLGDMFKNFPPRGKD